MKIALVNLFLFCGILVGHQPICSESSAPIQIVSIDNHTFHVDSESVQTILGNDRIKNRHVVIFCIAGVSRKGKSFFLNFALKYLHAKYVKHNISDWIGENENGDHELHGFKWSVRQNRETTGFWMWSEIFTYDYENGDEVAIILLDTQGIFDSGNNGTSIKDDTTIFAISTMLSSVQCYNIMQKIEEDHLQHLDLFTQYGQLAMNQTNVKPFQNLLFLVRDWPYPAETDYGYAPKQIEELLAGNNEPTSEMWKLRNRIKSSFQEIKAFLMPFPRLAVAVGMNTNGILSQIDPKFIKYMKKIVPSIFAPENLIVKRINGQKIRARDVITYLEAYIKIFNGNELPEPKTWYTATAEASILTLYNDCFEIYVDRMRKLMAHQPDYIDPSELLDLHEKAKKESLSQFQTKPKLGDQELISTYTSKLEEKITKEFGSIGLENKNKQRISEENVRLRRENEQQHLDLASGAACGYIGGLEAAFFCDIAVGAFKIFFLKY